MATNLRRAVLFAAATLAFVSCSGSGSGSDGASATGAAQPLAALLGFDLDQSPVEQRAQQLAIEDAVSQCMRSEGFEYTPFDNSVGQPINEVDAEAFANPEQFGERYGYGIVLAYIQFDEPHLGTESLVEEAPIDPNQQYANSLTDSERDAYYTALQGTSTFEPEEIDEDGNPVYQEPPIEEQGCSGKAQLDVLGPTRFRLDPSVAQRVADYYVALENDPEINAANRDWLICMEASRPEVLESDVPGFSVTDPDSVSQLFEFKKAQAMGTTILDYTIDGQGASSYSNAGEPQPIPDRMLESLRLLELETWQVDQKCRAEVDLPSVRQRVQQRLIEELDVTFAD